jgi:cobyric acid synthase CobQ/L-threonine-O-3-phosphate decarboxylase
MHPTQSGHGGNLQALAAESGRRPVEILDFSANINPLGPPAWLRPTISRHVEDLVHYPEPFARDLVEASAEHFGVGAERIVAGNGSTELLYALPELLDVRRAVIPAPCYIDYDRACRRAGVPVAPLPLREADAFVPDAEAIARHCGPGVLVILGQPGNPTGQALEPSGLRELIEPHPETHFLIDEAFADFCSPSVSLLPGLPENAIVLRSLTKFYAIPGLRVGLAMAAPQLAERLRQHIPPWSVNTLAQAVGVRALQDTEYARRSREQVDTLRSELADALDSIPSLQVIPARADYLLVKLTAAATEGRELRSALLREEGIAIRLCDNYEGLDRNWFRIAVRTREENQRLVAALRRRLDSEPAPTTTSRPKRRARALMIQGTCSNAGKSVLAAAFCRILLQDGLRVAPFKAQNMALNSFVTLDGGEMGRAQVTQAQACRLEPDVRMNPVLLKPSSDTGSQVIVMGRPVGTMRVGEYAKYKTQVWPRVTEAYDALAGEFDAIVLEGAGSPGEVNLKAGDIVNMRMAAHAEAAVLLAGDIDRGGVYASFIGTMEVLDPWERDLVAGFLVNRFRGDASLLQSAHRYIQDHTGLPVLGTVPHLADLGLPEEDSVTFKNSFGQHGEREAAGPLDVVLVDLPYISNFTDVDPLRIEPDVRLRTVRDPAELGQPDAILLPGSKSVINDLAFLEESGMAAAIKRFAADGGVVVGICAGLQMLGVRIADPGAVESSVAEVEGLGLLSLESAFATEKTLSRTTARHARSDLWVSGYEIHHGQSTAGPGTVVLFAREDGTPVGYAHETRPIWGTYLHGVFDNDAFRRHLLDGMRARKGLPPLEGPGAVYDLDTALDRLADAVRAHVDIGRIYELMGF